MRDLVALTGRHLREARRSRGARVLLVLLLLGILLPGGVLGASPRTGLWLAFLALATLALVVGAAAGSLIPADRRTGRLAWLRSLDAPSWTLRMAPAVAGLVPALLVGLLGGLAIGAALVAAGEAPGVRTVQTVVSEGSRIEVGRDHRLELDSAGALRTLEVSLRRSDAIGLRFRVGWEVAGTRGSTRLDWVEPLRLEVPAGVKVVRLWNETKGARLLMQEAVLLGAPRSFLGSMLLAGLVLGLVAATLAPVAVFLSRFTSAPTAVAGAFVLALAGVARPWLVGLLPPGASVEQGVALHVVNAAARLAPDLGVLGLLGHPGMGRALEIGALGGLLPILAYLVVALLLVALPLPRALEPDVLS